MANADFILDAPGMEDYKSKLLDLHIELMGISKCIDNIYNKLSGEVGWLGNGKEQCTAYFSLLDRFASLVAAEPINVPTILTNSALDEKNSEGTDWKYIQEMNKTLEEFLMEAERYSFRASDRAECITKLDDLNFYGR